MYFTNIQGGNSGIGLENCKVLAHAGARVILCSRSVANAEKAIETEIKKEGEGGYVVSDTSNVSMVVIVNCSDGGFGLDQDRTYYLYISS